MSDLFNPSSRISGIVRYCSHCKKDFICDGSCNNTTVTYDNTFCYCVLCWYECFGNRKPLSMETNRARCHLLETYLKNLGREKDFTSLGQVVSRLL